MPRRTLALISSRFSKSQRSCSSCVSSKRSSTSSTLLEPVAWSCFWSLASKDASRISLVMAGSLGFKGTGKGVCESTNPREVRDGSVEFTSSRHTCGQFANGLAYSHHGQLVGSWRKQRSSGKRDGGVAPDLCFLPGEG